MEGRVSHQIMTGDSSIPSDITRFILTSIPSVPHLEALLLLRRDPAREWDAALMARHLYIAEKRVGEMLTDLAAAGFIAAPAEGQLFHYAPVSDALRKIMDRVAEIYPKHLVEITQLIHSRIGKQAQQFGDAFKWSSDHE
jgi:hypothetical protein